METDGEANETMCSREKVEIRQIGRSGARVGNTRDVPRGWKADRQSRSPGNRCRPNERWGNVDVEKQTVKTIR